MKVWEKCNEVKGTDATREQIADWAYMNRICPIEFDIGLEIDIPLDEDCMPVSNGFLTTAQKICDLSCSVDCLNRYLDMEYDESADTWKKEQ